MFRNNSLLQLHRDKYPFVRRRHSLEVYFIIAAIFFQPVFAQQKTPIEIKTYPARDGAGARILLDGREIGRIEDDGTRIVELPFGTKGTLKVIKEGHEESSRWISVEALGLKFDFQLKKIIPPDDEVQKQKPRENYTLFISSTPGAMVYLNESRYGVIDGSGTISIRNLAPGKYKIKIKKEGKKTETREIQIPNTSGNSIVAQLGDRTYPHLSLAVIFFVILIVVFFFAFARNIANRGKVRFDRYIIESVIGRGGMATIYRARDTVSRHVVALKIIDAAFLTDADMIKKFIREGLAISEINKDFPQAPVVKVLNYGRENNKTKGRPFIAMEYLRGPNLLSIIQSRRPLTLRFIYSVIEQIARALSAAHSKGFYHRDITPDNIIVVSNNPERPVIKLIDFGVARHEYTAVGTLDGSISGKPPYMSPEQCRGEKVDGRSDQYSLGILLYTLLDGHPPFVSKNPFEVMKHHEESPVPPLKHPISDEVRAILGKMLSKKRSERFRTMEEFLPAFQKVVKESR